MSDRTSLLYFSEDKRLKKKTKSKFGMYKKFVTPPVWGARKRRPDTYAIHEYMNVRLPYSCIYLFSDVIKETQSLFSVAA